MKDDVARILAPKGVLRAAINLGNPVLAQRGANGVLDGISVRLACAFAAAWGLPIDLVPYDGAGRVVAAAGQDVWDIAFIAIDPLRAEEVAFTSPYLTIDGVFVVPANARYRLPTDLDDPAVRIGAGKDAAYELHLKRILKSSQIIQYPTSGDVLPGLIRDGLEAAAAIRQPAAAFVRKNTQFRVIEEPFMQIRQAVALPIAMNETVPLLEVELEALIANLDLGPVPHSA